MAENKKKFVYNMPAQIYPETLFEGDVPANVVAVRVIPLNIMSTCTVLGI